MTSQDELTRTAARLKDALGTAADVMTVRDSPELVREPQGRHARGWLLALAAAASVVLVVLGTMVAGQVYRHHATSNGAVGRTGPWPEYYVTLDGYSGKTVLDVRRTANGVVTASAPFSAQMLQAGYLTADAGDRTFFVALFPRGPANVVSKFFRITITGAGKISRIAIVGSPVTGVVRDLAAAPDGLQIAYTLESSGPNCINVKCQLRVQDAVHIMDLASGKVRTWPDTSAGLIPGRPVTGTPFGVVGDLSWAPDSHTLVVNEAWQEFGRLPAVHKLVVYGLDAASSGGSLSAHSRLLWQQGPNCAATCAQEALAGPDGSLTAAEVEPAGQQQSVQLIVRIPLASGLPPAVLYRALSRTPTQDSQAVIFSDSSGRWVITWPLYDAYRPGWQSHRAGWISDGRRYLLPGASPVYPNAIAW